MSTPNNRIKWKKICRTCQHWHESAYGECLASADRMIVPATYTCRKWLLARELRDQDREVPS